MSGVKPALTPEEWADGRTHYDGVCPTILDERAVELDGVLVVGQERHAVAALCLHGQPFGFTREDVRRLRSALYSEHYTDLADRIEALLPPEDV